jgi:hypothetical protein
VADIDWEESDSVWDGVPGADRLWLLYGYFPRFENARVVTLEFAATTLSARLYISEPVLEGYDADPPGGEIDPSRAHALATLRWDGVRGVSLLSSDNELEALWFETLGSGLATHLVDAGSGATGTIHAERVSVIEVLRPAEAGWIPDEERLVGTLRISWAP